MDDNYYMKMALQEAQKAYEAKEVPVGAVVVCKDRIIARAHNLTETLTDVTAHAEMQAITAAALVYGATDEKRGFMQFAPKALHPKTVVVKGVMAVECAELMRNFFASKRGYLN